MQITPRAIVLAVALCASAPLLAARPGPSTAGTDASMQETSATTEQADCTLPTLASTDLPVGLAGLLPKPGSTPQDAAEVDRRLSKAASCVRPLGRRWNDEPEDNTSPKRGFSVTAMPAGRSTAWPLQRSF